MRLTRGSFLRFNTWLVSLQDRRIPQAFVAVSGASSVGLGLLFLALPDRMDNAPSIDYLVNALPTTSWAAIFLVIGAVLVTLAIARYHWSWAVSAVMALVMFIFSAFTIVDVADGPATGLVALLAWSFGMLNLLSGVMAVAPVNVHIIETQDRQQDAA